MIFPSRIIRFNFLLGLLFLTRAFAVEPMVVAGYGHTVALQADGTVAVRGGNYPNGQLGGKSLKDQLGPFPVSEGRAGHEKADVAFA